MSNQQNPKSMSQTTSQQDSAQVAATAFESVTAVVTNVLASDFDKVEVNTSNNSAKFKRINPDFEVIESNSFTIYPEVLEKILCDSSICDCAADVSEFISCIGRHLEIREISMICSNANITLHQEQDHKAHDFFKPIFGKIILSENGKKRLLKAIDKYGEL